MRDHFIKRLGELAAKDPRITIVTGDLGFGVFDEFRSRYPDQFINAGVAEQNMTGIATGLAMEGRIVFTYSIGNFSTLRCLEQIRNDACYHNANVKIVSVGAGFSYGALGISHHATEDLTILRSLPNLTVVSPCGFWETTEATEALVKTDGTFFLRLDKSAGNDLPQDNNEHFEIGKARILHHGSDCAIMVIGGILEEVWHAVEILASKGIRADILSVHTIKPIDEEMILKIGQNRDAVVTVEEHTVSGGLGGAVAEVLLDGGVHPKKFLRIGLQAGFSSIVGSQKYLRQSYEMDAVSIATKIQSLLSGNNEPR